MNDSKKPVLKPRQHTFKHFWEHTWIDAKIAHPERCKKTPEELAEDLYPLKSSPNGNWSRLFYNMSETCAPSKFMPSEYMEKLKENLTEKLAKLGYPADALKVSVTLYPSFFLPKKKNKK